LPHERHLPLDSDCKFVPDPTEHVYHVFKDISDECDTETLNESPSQLPSKPMLYEGAGESIGDVKGFEQGQSNLYPPPW